MRWLKLSQVDIPPRVPTDGRWQSQCQHHCQRLPLFELYCQRARPREGLLGRKYGSRMERRKIQGLCEHLEWGQELRL
jgi:hypothetical protein